MMGLYKHLPLVFIMSISMGCNTASSSYEPLDLMSHGMPIKVMAPANSVIEMDDLGIMKDLTVIDTSNGGFNIQIFSSKTDKLDKPKVLAESKSEIESTEFFSKIISEDENGFIYEKKVTEDYINYDFRVIRLQGDVKYVIQSGFGEQYELEDIKRMFDAVK